MKPFVISLIIALFLSQGCTIHRHTVGNGPIKKQGSQLTIAKKKQWYMFWGLVPLNTPNTEKMRGGFKDYQIKSSTNVGDMLISWILFPTTIITRTVKIRVKREDYIRRYKKK